jgi:uncharacterized protein YbaR (Trm112 family)
MAVDPELLAILACPACDTRPSVILCSLEAGAAAQVVEKYRDKFRDEEPVVTEGLSCAACGRVYPIVSDIPVMLVEEALPAGARAS